MIVGAMELTDDDRGTLEVLHRLALALDVPVILAHALPTPGDSDLATAAQQSYLRACGALNAIADDLDAIGITAFPTVFIGNLETIERLSQQIAADYLVFHGYIARTKASVQRHAFSSSLT